MMECLNATGNAVNAGAFSQLFAHTVTSMVAASCLLVDSSQWPPDRTDYIIKNDMYEYDFIVVGAGSAGSVIANRLTEIEDWRILLIEAGGDPPIESQIPLFHSENTRTHIDWQYKTEPEQNACLSAKNQRCSWPRGKVLGGSSSINAMIYLRGNKEDYNNWEKLGNNGWGYEEVLKYFKKSENLDDESIIKSENAEKYHKTGGYLNVGSYNDTYCWVDYVQEGHNELGSKILHDLNGEEQIGVSKVQATIKNGVRHSTAKAFLSPIKGRQNLYVMKYAYATKIVINQNTNTAEGLIVKTESGKEIKVIAKKEVIVSAGAINSPQLLMLSGIGPKKHLEALGIKVLADLPVGENLQDHIMAPLLFTAENLGKENVDMNIATIQYLKNRSGPLATGGSISMVSFVNTKGDSSVPDIQYHHAIFPPMSMAESIFIKTLGFDDELTAYYGELNKDKILINVMVLVIKPISKGNILLKSKDPLDQPLIYANYFKENEDIQTMIRGFKEASKLENTNVFKREKAKLERIKHSACNSFEFRSDDYWLCVLKHFSSTLFHPVGTAKMGSKDDPTAVVNPRLSVKGIKGLRVADASIMPDIVRANTNAAAIMIGEKAADMIKEDWNKYSTEHEEL